MSRLTGNEAKGLMEAYNAVYAPQELTEEQIWEEVETWVNSLLEEGYDLSEYTWEEMYEAYINEASDLDMGLGKSVLKGGNKDRETRATAQRQVQTALGQGRGIDVRGATSGAAQGRGFGAVSGGRQGIVVNKPLKPGETQQINVGGRTLFPAKSGNRTVYLPSKDAKPATPLFKSSNKPVPPVDKDKPVPPTDKDKPVPPTRTPAAPAKVSPTPTKPAAAQTGDKAKDTATWAKANPTLASKVTPSGTQAGTGQSQMSKQAAELRAMRQRSQERQGVKTEEYDAYDLVLEYLLSEGHVETVEEAHYVMMEMDAEMIGTIVEAAADQSDKQIDKGVKTTYKAQNVLDNQHQGRSKGLNKLPAGERASKTKRMQGRLKARRDDLFGERNKREDSRRGELKKMLGL